MRKASGQTQKKWINQCVAAERIRVRFGTANALEYLIGEKLLCFVKASERHPECAAELPAFVAEVRRIFAPEEITVFLKSRKCEDALHLRHLQQPLGAWSPTTS